MIVVPTDTVRTHMYELWWCDDYIHAIIHCVIHQAFLDSW